MCNEDNKQNGGTKTPKNNHLLMYLLQNRAEDFIRTFEAQNNRCFMGVYSLYRMAYANKLILGDDDWATGFLRDVEKMRRENKVILDYLESIIPIPATFLEDYKEMLQRFGWFEDWADFEYMLDGSLDKLEEMGYRKIDCLLYEAGLKFNFKEFERLLALGADPYVKLSAYNPPSVASKHDTLDDVYSLYEDARRHLEDATDIYSVGECWEAGLSGTETIIEEDLIREFFLAAGCKLICESICNKN